MNALSILRAARVTIAKPEQWRQGTRRRGATTCCVAEAIESVSNIGSERTRALRALANAAGIPDGETIIYWNDAPERTHAEVMIALNLAIATLRLC